jgi:hypothetical protein
MKKFNPVYYLLFILFVMGAFASMAQNDYGLKIMGGVAFVFSFLFLFQLIDILRKNGKKDMLVIAELTGLMILSAIFGLRVFYIHFPYVEYLFSATALLLALVYLRKLLLRFRQYKTRSNLLAFLVLVFHLSIILFLLSLAAVPFAQKTSVFLGFGALVLLLFFMLRGFFRGELLVEGEHMTAFKMVKQFKDHSIIIISLFLLFSLYVGFNRIGLLPGIYSDEFPQAYYELVDRAASKKEKPVDGRYKHEEFKKKYDQFLKHINIK